MDSKQTCSKVRYGSEKAADADIKRIRGRSTRPTVPIRSYLCKICGAWHLTSRKDFEKIIADLKGELEKTKVENASLKVELSNLKHEYNNLKSNGTKEERAMIRADIRVKKLTEQLTEKGKQVNKLRKESQEMIIRLLQLQKQLEEKQ